MTDDGSSKAMRYALDQVRCIEELYANGQLEVWDAGMDRLLGRCDPFLPQNIAFHTLDQWGRRTRERLEAEAERRRVAGR